MPLILMWQMVRLMNFGSHIFHALENSIKLKQLCAFSFWRFEGLCDNFGWKPTWQKVRYRIFDEGHHSNMESILFGTRAQTKHRYYIRIHGICGTGKYESESSKKFRKIGWQWWWIGGVLWQHYFLVLSIEKSMPAGEWIRFLSHTQWINIRWK